MKSTSTELTVQIHASEQQLTAAKQPRGHSETIAVLAFALAEASRLSHPC
jgi:hypothetical protein